MADLNTQSQTTILQNWAASVQGACKTLLDLTVGSILLSIGQAMSGVALWLQGLILQLLAATRLGTSQNSDVDTFCADFMPVVPDTDSPRLPAVSSTGPVTLARFTPTNAAFIPAQQGPIGATPNGAVIQTADGTQTFVAIPDTNQSAYSPSLGGYVIPAGNASISATVQALNAGTQGNISANTLTVLQTGLSGVDTVTNPSAFINGIDEESDDALKVRFQNFINGLSKGTDGAIMAAINSLQQGLQVTISNNVDLNGATDNGMVTVIVDDGSGNIPGAILTAAQNAVEAVRAAGVRIGVYAAAKVIANTTMTITTAAGYDHGTVLAQVIAAITAYINGLGLGNSLSYARLSQVAFNASPGVIDVTNYTLNSGTADIVATKLQTIKAGTISAS